MAGGGVENGTPLVPVDCGCKEGGGRLDACEALEIVDVEVETAGVSSQMRSLRASTAVTGAGGAGATLLRIEGGMREAGIVLGTSFPASLP